MCKVRSQWSLPHPHYCERHSLRLKLQRIKKPGLWEMGIDGMNYQLKSLPVKEVSEKVPWCFVFIFYDLYFRGNGNFWE